MTCYEGGKKRGITENLSSAICEANTDIKAMCEKRGIKVSAKAKKCHINPNFRQDRVLQRAERPVCDGCHGVRQHAHVVGGLHQDDGEGKGRRCTSRKF